VSGEPRDARGQAETRTGAPLGSPRPTVLWHIFTAAWALMAAPMSASLSPPFMLMLVAAFFGGALGLIWSVQLLRVLLDREARSRLTRRASVAWAAYPTIGLLLVALFLSQWPFALRVKLSEPALLRLAGEVEDGRTRVGVPCRAGLVSVDSADVRENCVLLFTGAVFLTECGLAYSRDGKPPALGHPWVFRHLFGRWYTFQVDLF
jgi:hypothetical protein